jgi:hypothetical protein
VKIREHPHKKAHEHAEDCANRRKQQRDAGYAETFIFKDTRKVGIASNLVKRDAENASNGASNYGPQPLIRLVTPLNRQE